MNRLKTAELGDPTESIGFQYTDPRVLYQPTVISIGDLGLFRLNYSVLSMDLQSTSPEENPSGTPLVNPIGLSRVLTPSGLNRDFALVRGLGVHRLLYTPWPGSPGPWIYEWGVDLVDSASPAPLQSDLLRFTWPSGFRRFSHFPQQSQFVFDRTTVQWNMDGLQHAPQFNHPLSAPYSQLTDITSGHRMTVRRSYLGTLLTTVHIDQHIPGARNAHPTLGGLLHSRYTYTYNSNLNLMGIRTQLFTQSSDSSDPSLSNTPTGLVLDEETVLKYDPVTGHLLSICELDVVHRPSAVYITYAPKGLQLYRQTDELGRIRQVVLYSLSSRRDPLYNLSLLYRPNSMEVIQQREEQRGQVPRWVTFVHGPSGKLRTLIREEAGSSLRAHTSLTHNSEGRIAHLRISISDPQLPPAGYFEAGSTSRSEELQFVYDTRGLLKRRGNWQYEFDEDGFLVERRLHNDHIIDRFAYNSKGLLIWAERNLNIEVQPDTAEPLTASFDRRPMEDDIGSRRAFRMQYVYDTQDRLVVIRDMLIVRDLMQYFYADPVHPNRITHVFNHGRLVTFRFHYDPVLGHLVAMEEFDMATGANNDWALSKHSSSATPSFGKSYTTGPASSNRLNARQERKHIYFVITTHEGAPIALISEDGKTTWTAEYSATGSRRLNVPSRSKFYRSALLEDANLPLGHTGCLVDVHTAFLFCPPTWRAYDPFGATYTSPDWRGLLPDRLAYLPRDPSVLDTHKWGLIEQQNAGLGSVGLTDRLVDAIRSPNWWLKQTGLDPQALLPHLDSCTGAIGLGSSTTWNLPDLPGQTDLSGQLRGMYWRDCPAARLNAKLEHLSMIQPGRLTPGGSDESALPSFLLHRAPQPFVQLVPLEGMFGPEVFFELDSRGNVLVSSASSIASSDVSTPAKSNSDVFNSARLAICLLTGARLLDWWTEVDRLGGSPTMLVQSLARLGHVTSTLNELTELGLKLPLLNSATGHNLTLQRTADFHEMRLTRQTIQWRIRFVSSWNEAQSQTVLDAEQRGRVAAWARETQMVRRIRLAETFPLSADRIGDSTADTQLLGLNYLWTLKELSQLRQAADVPGYQWVPVLNLSASKNGTAFTRLIEDPGIYQLRPIDSSKMKRYPG
ncbi:hypothetical protein P879_02020 [Paragonimus westermani]|uniref:Teneurin-like YD-shell domain-containing protein n=1 Tax=Paragonimus westermani TaxID=34504 RepID=A0A8T0DYM3_9TREM|nr:hypothetical protein P879_02020 [Paragonimus westermani]